MTSIIVNQDAYRIALDRRGNRLVIYRGHDRRAAVRTVREREKYPHGHSRARENARNLRRACLFTPATS